MRSILLALLAVTLVTLPLSAQKRKRNAAAPPRAAVTYPMPAVRSDSLANGLRVLHTRVNSVPIVEVNLMIDAGLNREAAGEEGLAQLTSRLLFAGTPTRRRADVISQLSTIGATMSTYTTREYSQVYLRCLTRHLPRALDVMADIVMNASFPAGEVNRESQRLQQAMAGWDPNAGERASLELFSALYGPRHALARPLLGGQNALRGIGPADVQRYHRMWYRPERATLSVAGNVDPGILVTLVKDRFGAWARGEKGAASESEKMPVNKDPEIRIIDNASQAFAQIRWGVKACGRADALFVPTLVMNQIFGGGRGSRLQRKLWEEHPVLPSFFSTYGVYGRGGSIVLGGSAPAARIDSVLLWMDEAIHDMVQRPPTDAELAAAKRELTRNLEFMYETNKKMQEQLLDVVVYGISPELVRGFGDAVQRVSAADVQRAAREAFAGTRRVIAINGNARLFVEALKARYRGQVTLSTQDGAAGSQGE